MYALLLPLGVICAIAGLVSLGFGVPIKEFALGNTLIIVGTIGFVGGLTIIALAAAVRHLSKISLALGSAPRPVARPRAGEPESAGLGRDRPPARPAPPRAASAPQSDRPAASHGHPSVDADAGHERARRPPAPARASDATDDDGGEAPPTVPAPARDIAAQRRHDDDVEADREATSHEPAPVAREPAVRDSLERVTPSAASRAQERTDAAPRSSVTRPSEPKLTSPFDAVWPAGGRGNAPKSAAQPASAPPAGERERDALRAAEARVSILKSGVIDGMAYTLYTDGSIEAQLPQGTMRFSSIEDLRVYLESNG